MADEDEVVVTLEPELPGFDTTTKVVTDESAVGDLKSQFDELKAKGERDRVAKESAERRAREARQDATEARKEADAAKSQVAESQLETIDSSLSGVKAEVSDAKRAYKAAMDAGDFDAAAEAQEKIADAAARGRILSEAKADLEAHKAAKPEPETRRAETRERTPPAADPMENWLRQFTEPTANWIREHPDWVKDKKKNAKLTAAHADAVANDVELDTPEYFAHVESYIGLHQAETGTNNGTGNGAAKPAPKVQRRSSVPAAPVTASGGGTSGGGPTVRLTKGQEERANDGSIVWGKHDLASGRIKDASKIGTPIGTQEYARRVHERFKERGNENPNVDQ
jgi:hypothetical protein